MTEAHDRGTWQRHMTSTHSLTASYTKWHGQPLFFSQHGWEGQQRCHGDVRSRNKIEMRSSKGKLGCDPLGRKTYKDSQMRPELYDALEKAYKQCAALSVPVESWPKLAWQWPVLWDEWCRMMTNVDNLNVDNLNVDDTCWQRSGSHQRVFQNVPRTESAATGKSTWLLILLSPVVRYAIIKCWSVFSIQILYTYWAMVINPLNGICIRITRLPLWEWWPQPIFDIYIYI